MADTFEKSFIAIGKIGKEFFKAPKQPTLCLRTTHGTRSRDTVV